MVGEKLLNAIESEPWGNFIDEGGNYYNFLLKFMPKLQKNTVSNKNDVYYIDDHWKLGLL